MKAGRQNLIFSYQGRFFASREIVSLRKEKLLPDHLFENKLKARAKNKKETEASKSDSNDEANASDRIF